MKSTQLAKYWIDGKLVRADKASLPLTDLTVTRGYGAFEALRTYERKPFLLVEHLKRLEKTCAHLCLKCPLNRKELIQATMDVLEANSFPESLIRYYVTGGDSSGFLPEGNERMMILVGAAKSFPAWQYEKGIAVKTTELCRPIPHAKTIDYTAGIRETYLAFKQGYQEVVFRDKRGALLEGTQFSIFAIVGRTLITPEDDVLPGVTAMQVMKLAKKEGFTIQRSAITPAMLRKASECFITSTNREVLPVARIDEQMIGSGAPGPATRLIHERYLSSTMKAVAKMA